jgi:hypothetical protein
MASEIGRMSAADAILDRIVITVSPRGHFPRGWFLRTASIAIMAPITCQLYAHDLSAVFFTHTDCAYRYTEDLE